MSPPGPTIRSSQSNAVIVIFFYWALWRAFYLVHISRPKLQTVSHYLKASEMECIGHFNTASGDALSERGLFSFPTCSPCCPLCGLWNNLDPINMIFLGCIKTQSDLFSVCGVCITKHNFTSTKRQTFRKARVGISLFKTCLTLKLSCYTHQPSSELKKKKPDQVTMLSKSPLPWAFTYM
jgi:hypothetical protein